MTENITDEMLIAATEELAGGGQEEEVTDSPQEFAEKTIYLLRHPEVAKIMGRKGRKVIEKHYSWESIGKKMYKVYEDVGQLNQAKRC